MNKITLKTLPLATEQEVFDQVKAHLLTQNKQSVDHEKCLYRGPDNTKCAAGIFIDDDRYTPDFEGRSWSGVAEKLGVRAHCELIGGLQIIHDNREPSEWKNELRLYAEKRGLVYNEV